MFIVERQGSGPIVAGSPEEAVLKHRLERPKDGEDTYYNVWNTMTTDFYVVKHRADWDPISGPTEFEHVIHFDAKERKRLVEEMMFKAHCDDAVLRQLCEMAALQINDEAAYNDWVGEGDEADA